MAPMPITPSTGSLWGGPEQARNPYSFSEDAIQELQVNTNNYAAEIGRAGGGVINVITKSGTNSFHGDAFEFYRDKALQREYLGQQCPGQAEVEPITSINSGAISADQY